MAGYDDTTSTEKLLNVIRKSESGAEPGAVPFPDAGSGKKKVQTKVVRSGKGVCVGVDISYAGLRLARITKKKQLLDCRTIPFTREMDRSSTEFAQFLRAALSEFCGSGRGVEIWSVVPASGLELRYLKIPKVPKKQISNAVFWTYKKENPFNEKEAVFDYEILGDITDDGVRRTEVLAYTAPLADIEDLKSLFARAGYPLTGVTAIPFAFQNLFRTGWIKGGNQDVCNLYVGRNWSRIDVFSHGNLILSRGIKAGMNSMVEAIKENINRKRREAPMGGALEMDDPSQPVSTSDSQARMIFEAFAADQMASSGPAGNGFTSDEIFEMVTPALDRLVRQTERTLEHYRQKLKVNPISQVYTSGLIGTNRKIVAYVGSQLGLTVDALDQSVFAGPAAVRGGEKAGYAPAIGLALSDNSITPNFLYTYKQKAKEAETANVRMGIIGVFAVVMAVLGGVYLYQGSVLNAKLAEQQKLEAALKQFAPQVTREMILDAMGVMERNNKLLDKYAREYLGLAVMSELTSMTPPDIRLINVTAELGTLPAPDDQKKADQEDKKASQPVRKTMTLEGIVTGEKKTVESALAQYLLRLQISPLFGKPAVKEQAFKVFDGSEVLVFTAEVEVI